MAQANRIWQAAKQYRFLFTVTVICLFLNFSNNDFPYQFHADEAKKLRFILNDTQDFNHPILMLQAARVLNFFAGLEVKQELIQLCRSVSAISGLLLLLAGYFFSRRIFDNGMERLVAILICFSPILVVHAHYFKEDMIFAAAAFFSLLCYMRYLEERTWKWLLALALTTGLAFSAQYKGLLLIPLYLVFPVLNADINRKGLFKGLILALGGAAIVTLAVNYPALLDPHRFLDGVKEERGHILGGHTLAILPLPQYFSFHLRNSLLPGLTFPIVAVGLIGLTTTLIKWKSSHFGFRLLAVFVLLFYLSHEIVPMKTAPGFIRYMIPVTPAILIFTVKGFVEVKTWLIGRSRRVLTSLLATTVFSLKLVLILIPLAYSMLLVYNLNELDTRVRAIEATDRLQGKVYYDDAYTKPDGAGDGELAWEDLNELKKQGYTYVVTSSFGYDRYLYGARLEGQDQEIYATQKHYEDLFMNPTIEIKPHFKSFAFSNPVIKIIDIRAPIYHEIKQ